jgi:DNA-binding NarL/FixJ family response regulator
MSSNKKEGADENAGKMISVAVVEDDDRVRKSLVGILRRSPACVCLGDYASGEEALPALLKAKPSVVVMDINLPGMSGVECARLLTQQEPYPQIIMLTVYQDTDTIFEALSAGASGYLLKPVRAEELVLAVRDVYTGGAPLSSGIARKLVRTFQQNPTQPSEGKEEVALSPREKEILDLLAQGYLYKEIADQLQVGYRTVHTHIEHIYSKLHVRSRSQAVAKRMGGNPLSHPFSGKSLNPTLPSIRVRRC